MGDMVFREAEMMARWLLFRCGKFRANVSLFLTIRCMKAYQTFGVNFLPMSASSELEPGPSRVTTSGGLEGAANVGCSSRASREKGLRAQADGRGGFTAG